MKNVKIKILGKGVSVEAAREVWLELGEIFDYQVLPCFEYDNTLDLDDDNVLGESGQSDSKAALGLVDFAKSKGFTLEGAFDGDKFWHSDTGIISQFEMEDMHKDYLFEL